MQKNEGQHGIYEASFRKAAQLLRSCDVDRTCDRCGAERKGSRILLPYFTEIYAITLPDVVFDPPSISSYEQVLILHYLTTGGESKTKGEYVSFTHLSGASFYEPTYRRRGPEKILSVFGGAPEKITGAAEKLGGGRAEYGDVSVRIRVFPKLEAVVVLHRGDDEFPPEANILYGDDIVNFLPLEDIAVLSGLIASRLKRALG